jgi:protein-S-isoprenylcysteine O-methyltransferase Ste14
MIIFDIILITLLYSIFAVSHSFLALRRIKKTFTEKMGARIAFYRLFYNITSIIFLLALYIIAPHPDIIVYDLQFPFDIITFALQILSLYGLIWAGKSINWREFLGITQITRYFRNEYIIDDLDERPVLNTTGAFKFVRHPIYFFSILFLCLRPTMNLFYLIVFICTIIYFYIGSFYEENKLIEIFGDEYAEYKKRVSRIFPVLFFLKKHKIKKI